MLKTYLKTARQALQDKDNQLCIRQCESALELDPRSYNALVFSGLAYSNLDDFTKGEVSYQRAIDLDGKNLLAWQGLLNLYQNSGQVSKFVDTSSRIAAVHAENSEDEKCLLAIQKALSEAKDHGSPTEIAQSLRLILPVSPFFRLLEDKLPEPADTYVKLATITEAQDSSQISSSIAKGRSRLGVKLDQLTRDVKNTVYSASELEAIYEEIINWSHEEHIRRDAESKLLHRAVEKLKVSHARDKPPQLQRIMSIAKGMTVVKVNELLAWSIVLDWSDVPLDRLDLNMILTFIAISPGNLYSKALQLYTQCSASGFSAEDLARFTSSDDKACYNNPVRSSEVIVALTDAYEADEKLVNLLCLRLLLSLYLSEKDWPTVIDLATTCSELLVTIKAETSAELTRSQTENDLCLATAYTYHRAPRFHGQAIELFDQVILSGQDRLIRPAMIGKARVLRESKRPGEAQEVITAVLRDSPDDKNALLEQANCYEALGLPQEAVSILLPLSAEKELSREALASIYYQLGQCRQQIPDTKDDIYGAFIQSLRYDPGFAPAYTALGLYYADVIHDERRAEKCFQKALELSSAELDAAERLATIFADDGDWDLVEIITQRVLQGNERLEVPWPYRAIGFVHLHTGNYQQAISAFQSGLRIATMDVDAWIGLGESYLELGRHQAAAKAFARASAIAPNNWYAKYLTATISSTIGAHEEACTILQELIVAETHSASLKISLCLAYLAWAKYLASSGWISKSNTLLVTVLELCLELMSSGTQSASVFDILGQCGKLLSSGVYAGDTKLEAVLDKLEATSAKSDLERKFVVEVPDMTLQCRCAAFSLRAYCHCIEAQELETEDEALYWFEIGKCSLSITKEEDHGHVYNEKAIIAFQSAVKLDPVKAMYWSALGVSVAAQDSAFAHHCFVKAVSLNDKSAIYWTNLGYFYLKTDHLEAANQAFVRAQTLDPSAALAWLGQAIISFTMAESDPELFEHALRLANIVDIPLAAIKYVESVLRQPKLLSISKEAITKCLWSLEEASKCNVNHELRNVLIYLRILILEYGPDEHLPLTECLALAESLEESYEQDESPEILKRYCDVKAVLARLQLRLKDYESAIETASSVIDLEPEDCPESLKSCRLVVSIAQSCTGETEEAIATLKDLVASSTSDPHVLTLLRKIVVSSESTAGGASNIDSFSNDESSPSYKLFSAAVIALKPASSQKERALANAALTELLLSRDPEIESDRELVERVLERKSNILQSQLQLNPLNSDGWLQLALQGTSKSRARTMKLAMHGAEEEQDPQKIAKICLASDDAHLRVVGLHLSPESLLHQKALL